jgi:glycosyltransferase involved in cell wall biosynthesis
MLNFFTKRIFLKSKIVHIINSTNIGGAENIFFNVVKEFNKKDIVIISLTCQGYYGKKLKNKGFTVYSINMKKNIFILFQIFKLFYLINIHRPEVVHTWLYHSNLIGGIIAKLSKVKKIYWSIHHDYEYSNILMMIEMKLLSILSHLIPNKIIFCSYSSKKNHIKNGYNQYGSLVIDNGICLSKFKNDSIFRKKIRSKLKIRNGCFLLGNISRYHPLKDHDTLLKSLTFLKLKGKSFKCILIGNGLTTKNIELVKKIKKYNLEKEVILYGSSNKIYQLINAFDLNILSSKSESFPVTLLESMASGVPCISTNVGDAKNIIGNSGWIVNPEDSYELGNCISKIIDKRDLLKEKSKLSKERVEEFFSLERMNYRYKKLY